MRRLLGPFKQVITMSGLPWRGPLRDGDLNIIANGGILVDGETIVDLGPYQLLNSDGAEIADMHSDQLVCLPGFIDAHTHLCYAGNRINDYAARISGRTYEEIARQGGGIWSSVQDTRAASQDDLIASLQTRLKKHSAKGITTIEVKSGYGLNVDDEVKMLEAIQRVNNLEQVDVIPTCLGAHVVPRDFTGDSSSYLSHLLDELVPLVWEKNLTKRVDIFIDDLAFTPEDSAVYLSSCQQLGFDLTVHGDQFSSGGSLLAVRYKAKSVDHLECIRDDDLEALAKSNTVAMVLPGASLGLGMPFAPARKLLDQGAILAIASDANPGSAPMGDLLIQASLLSAYEKLSIAEVLAGISFRAAHALGLNDRGILAPGKLADMCMFPTDDYREIFYHQGTLKPVGVWKKGKQIV